LPATSRKRTVSMESPGGSIVVSAIKSQNWAVVPGVIVLGSPDASVYVHGDDAVYAWNRQAKSLSASVTKEASA